MIILFNHLPVDNDNDDQLSLNQSLSLINFKNDPVQKQPKKYESKFCSVVLRTSITKKIKFEFFWAGLPRVSFPSLWLSSVSWQSRQRSLPDPSYDLVSSTIWMMTTTMFATADFQNTNIPGVQGTQILQSHPHHYNQNKNHIHNSQFKPQSNGQANFLHITQNPTDNSHTCNLPFIFKMSPAWSFFDFGWV